jgi:hypothetical protein
VERDIRLFYHAQGTGRPVLVVQGGPGFPDDQPWKGLQSYTEPAEYPGGGTYHGHAEVEAHMSLARGTWAEGSCEPEHFIVAGDKIIECSFMGE